MWINELFTPLFASAMIAAPDPGMAPDARRRQILGEFEQFLSIPNLATDRQSIEKNAALLTKMMEHRGILVRRLKAEPGTAPVLLGELTVPGAARTVLFYAHYDGQAANADEWTSPPWRPEIRVAGKRLDWRKSPDALDGDAAIYARSASDDKGAIQALLSAVDLMRESKQAQKVNIKFLFEGEEEQGSPHLAQTLQMNRDALRSDLVIFADGPMHQSGAHQIFNGARGFGSVELAVFGPIRAVHDGHYGNWVPNPAVTLASLLARIRDEEGAILIPNFHDDVRGPTPEEEQALSELPDVETALRHELGLGRTEGRERLLNSTFRPALNIRGIRAGAVGAAATNAIPTQAEASIDFRYAPGQQPARVRKLFEAFLRREGWHIVRAIPDSETRRRHGKIILLSWSEGYPATITPIDSAPSRALARTVRDAIGGPLVHIPMAGGSIPMHQFASALDAPVLVVPISNYDSNQHAADENLRLSNLWSGIELYARLYTHLAW